jgi:hypothetical protein
LVLTTNCRWVPASIRWIFLANEVQITQYWERLFPGVFLANHVNLGMAYSFLVFYVDPTQMKTFTLEFGMLFTKSERHLKFRLLPCVDSDLSHCINLSPTAIRLVDAPPMPAFLRNFGSAAIRGWITWREHQQGMFLHMLPILLPNGKHKNEKTRFFSRMDQDAQVTRLPDLNTYVAANLMSIAPSTLSIPDHLKLTGAKRREFSGMIHNH